MTFTDTLLIALQQSAPLDPQTLITLANFLQQHRTLIDAAGDDARQAFFAALGQGDPTAAWNALSANLNSGQILAHLRDTQTEMAALTAARQQAIAQYQSALDTAGLVAMRFLARAAFSVL